MGVRLRERAGGSIRIGVDDDGNVVGLEDYKRLMEEIPDKIKSTMGIVADVNLLREGEKRYIEASVSPYSVPISLNGRHYCRSGGVKQELTGTALNEFVLRRCGRTWDDLVEPRASIEDIDADSVASFMRRAREAGRMPDADGVSLPDLLEKLSLSADGQIKRAAIVLFGKNPGRFYPNTFVKMGRFEDDDYTIRYQETEEGNIIRVLDAVLEQLDHKFMIRNISFEGMSRIETLEYPVAALREMILNALIHRNYAGAPTQIRVYDDKMFVWNDGGLPESLPMQRLRSTHSSHPRNPTLARACFLGGYIDSWGSGIMKIVGSCEAAGLPAPGIEEREGGFMVTLFKDRFSREELQRMGFNARQVKAVSYVKRNGRITNREYTELNECSRNTATADLKELSDRGVFESIGRGAGATYLLILSLTLT
ncbi:MAG: hypothetical protein LBG62_03820 [Candidatus Methanoplasma sp.]|jgi:ATP-dependent DNA helicase RecG|nr:hypothetical protein [Candidatus Methanoplasma sp.]